MPPAKKPPVLPPSSSEPVLPSSSNGVGQSDKASAVPPVLPPVSNGVLWGKVPGEGWVAYYVELEGERVVRTTALNPPDLRPVAAERLKIGVITHVLRHS